MTRPRHPEDVGFDPALRLAPGHYGADDLSPGVWIDCGRMVVSAAMIDDFAGLTGDRFEIHMSQRAARAHGFDARVAHGLLVLSLVDGLKNNADAQIRARASRGWDWRFSAPVLAGDTIAARLAVESISEARSADQAILSLRFEVRNQRDEVVQSGVNSLLAYR